MVAAARARSARAVKADPVVAEAVELARAAAMETAGLIGVGEHLGFDASADRVISHYFGCPHPGYAGWRWSVTLVRAAWAKTPTVNEVVLLPSAEALLAQPWVPWADRIGPGDVTAGLLMPTATDDPRLEPGYTGGESAADTDPVDRAQARLVATEFGLGRERVLSRSGRDDAAERWQAGDSGPDNESSRLAPAVCGSCGFFVRLEGSLGVQFGACANVYSAADGKVVSVDHGCGGHSSVVSEPASTAAAAPAWETIIWDEPISMFD